MTWARAFTPVPRPVAQGADAEGSWLVTEAVPGETAVLDRWKAEPERAVAAPHRRRSSRSARGAPGPRVPVLVVG